MAVAFKTALGTGQATTSGTTITITTTAAIAIGDLVVVRWASDNLNATTPTATCADGGNTYTLIRQASVNATAAAGVAGGFLVSKATVARPSGSTITVTLSGAVAHKCAMAESFTGAEITVRVAAVGATGTATAASAGATAAGLVAGDLVLGHLANETRGTITGDTDTTNGAWSTQVTHRSSSSGSDATNVSVAGQYKIVTATGAQTYNVTAVAAEWVCQCVVLQASPEPAITQAAYRWYQEGTESGALPYVNQDTAIQANISAGDATGTLRIRLQSTTANAVFASDDWQLQYEKNTSGTWVNIITSSPLVQTYDSPNLTNAAATTNRLTGGTGSFVAGKVSEDGLMDDLGWAGNNYTELVYALKVLALGQVNGDTLRFRVLRNGSTTTMTYAVTPQINLFKNDPPVVALGLPTDAATTTDATPEFTFTGTDPQFDDIRYQIQIGPGGFTPIDQYGVENATTTGILNLGGNTRLSQSFLGLVTTFDRVRFSLAKLGAPTGNIVARLYAHTGSFGVSGVPTGTALATSDPVDASTLPVSPTFALTDFTFSAPYTMSVQLYCVTIEFSGGDTNNRVYVQMAVGTATHDGNYADFAAGWIPVSTADLCFYAETSGYTALINSVSGSDAGFVNISNGADTDPFADGNSIRYTVQSALAVPAVYGWRVRAIDPAGSNTWGAWTAYRTLGVEAEAVPPQTWDGSVGTLGAEGISGSFTPGGASWSGSIATVGVAGVSNAFVAGDVAWISSSISTIGILGVSDLWTAVGPPQTWVGSIAIVGIVSTSDVFIGGATTWVGSIATVGIISTSGIFVGGAVTWVGSIATVGVSVVSGTFIGGATTWIGSIATISTTSITGDFVLGAAPPQTWVGSTATIGTAALTGIFIPGSTTWVGSTATIGVVGTSGAYSPGVITWIGSTTSIGVAANSGVFTPGAVIWTGSTATIGVFGISGVFVGAPVTWTGSIATIGINAISGLFVAGGQGWIGSIAAIGVNTISGTFIGGSTTWVTTSAARIGVSGTSSTFTGGAATWVSASTAGIGIAGTTSTMLPGVATWIGSVSSIGVSGMSVVWGMGGKPKVWNGSEWVEKPVKVWNGSVWVEKPMKRWTGSQWELV